MKCPICKKTCKGIKENEMFPFCSDKCKHVDLYNWFSGEYNYQEPEPAPLVIEDERGEN